MQGPSYNQLLIERLGTSGDLMLLNMGPQHPSTHGVINFLIQTDGEVMRKAVPQVGFLHRGIEKIAELVQYPQFMPYTDRVDYLAAMTANEGYALAVEKLLGLEVPARARYLRAIAAELNRIASHLVGVGSNASDIGAFTPFVHALREREAINDLIEALCGARLTYNYARIGGVAFDLPDGWADRLRRFLDHFEPFLDEFDRLISYNKIFIERLADVATISADEAIAWGLCGPSLRGSGVAFDCRRDVAYGAYPDFKFEVIVGKGWQGTLGDAFDRYYVRVLEMMESCKILRQALDKLPEGEVMAKVPRRIKPEPGEAMARVESARGELAYYVVSDGTEKPYRVRIRTGSFMAMGIIEPKSEGLMIADLVALIASFDVVAPEIDR
ncbi:MAG: NADH-quinone oxidoreductase subunit D [Deltaproteobacteria bacterium]|nr:NADH-quinone oxidoreductase subunit D [Deltaproteobacteria bacterium]